MDDQKQLLIGWVAKALDLLLEVDQYTVSDEWRKDVDALQVRFHNYVEKN